jgi:hypothetical protein
MVVNIPSDSYGQVMVVNIPNEECDKHPFMFSWDEKNNKNNASQQEKVLNIPNAECDMFLGDQKNNKNKTCSTALQVTV